MACIASIITKGIPKICDTFVAGTKDKLILMNFDDYTANYNVDFPDVITSIVNKTGKVGVVFTGQNNSAVAKSSATPTTYAVSFTHTVDFTAFSVKPEDLEQLNILARGRVIAVWKDKNGTINVCGINGGLKVTAMEMDSSNADYGTCRRITLTGAEEKKDVNLFGTYTLAPYVNDLGVSFAPGAIGYVKTSAYNEAVSNLAFEALLTAGV